MPHFRKIEIENVEHLTGGFPYNQLHTRTRIWLPEAEDLFSDKANNSKEKMFMINKELFFLKLEN